jgi:hypothetical protein
MINGELAPANSSGLHRPKAKWTADEDEILVGLVQVHGAQRWNVLADSLPGRTGKQCRERWLIKLSPECVSALWTLEEDQTLLQLQAEYGNTWSKFRTLLPGRSIVSIKNRWTSLKRRGLEILSAIPQIASPVQTPIPYRAPTPPDPAWAEDLDVTRFGFGADDSIFGSVRFDDLLAEDSLWSF